MSFSVGHVLSSPLCMAAQKRLLIAPFRHCFSITMEESTQSRLERLRRENAERWKTLKELQKQCNDKETDTADDTAANTQTNNTALSVELSMLQQSMHSSQDYNLNFSQEVVASYDDLRQTNAVLERDSKRAREKLEATQQTISQHRTVENALKSMQTKDSENGNGEENRPEKNDCEDENQWVREELSYVSQLLHEGQRKRRRRDESNTETVQQSSWSLDRLVLELTRRYLSSALDPYLLVSSLPVEAWQIDLLRQSTVIQVHPDNPDLICLSNYNCTV